MPELVNCPHCDKKLKVPDNLLGKTVKCPQCTKTFTAQAIASAPAPVAEEDEAPPPPRKRPSEEIEPRPSKRAPVDEDDEDDRPAPRRRLAADDDDDEDDDRPRRRKRGGKPHRGVLILVLAILGFLFCPILYPIAWIMGNADIKEIRAGRMDADGEGLTQAGRIIGMIGTILMLVGLVLGVVFVIIWAVASR